MDAIEPGEYEAFVIKRRRAYLARFARFDALGGSFTPTWHWPAFFFAPWWLLYRKMYLWAVLAFIVSLRPQVALFAHLACGVTGYYLYYRRARSAIASLKQAFPGQDIRGECMDAGGVHGWAPVLALVALSLILAGLAVSGLLAVIFARYHASWV
ncbi:MAG: DUF2628 domain-containing protein [Desulfovibrionaceae bacterium]|nr:DUF2628 domain-containing protein [Desulfovibrionaceae bacterium]MBF0515089.1 DUF2628 domain-containing protein [Desulfovibrionaceae bacterium]